MIKCYLRHDLSWLYYHDYAGKKYSIKVNVLSPTRQKDKNKQLQHMRGCIFMGGAGQFDLCSVANKPKNKVHLTTSHQASWILPSPKPSKTYLT